MRERVSEREKEKEREREREVTGEQRGEMLAAACGCCLQLKNPPHHIEVYMCTCGQ